MGVVKPEITAGMKANGVISGPPAAVAFDESHAETLGVCVQCFTIQAIPRRQLHTPFSLASTKTLVEPAGSMAAVWATSVMLNIIWRAASRRTHTTDHKL